MSSWRSCRAVRRRIAGSVRAAEETTVQRHLGACPACRELLRRRKLVAQVLSAHPPVTLPDSSFVSRVSAQLEGRSAELLGWAALKLLPPVAAATAALIWIAVDLMPRAHAGPMENLASWAISAERSFEGQP